VYRVMLTGIFWTLKKEHHHTATEESILNLLVMTLFCSYHSTRYGCWDWVY